MRERERERERELPNVFAVISMAKTREREIENCYYDYSNDYGKDETEK